MKALEAETRMAEAIPHLTCEDKEQLLKKARELKGAGVREPQPCEQETRDLLR